MTNLNSAKQALKTELAQAKQGMAYYASRMEALQEALEQLDRLDGEQAGTRKTSAKAGATARKQTGAKRGRKPGSPRANGGDLPSTAGEFWQNLISAKELSAPEVLDAAITTLGITPTPEQKKKLANRMVAALNHLVKTKAIADSGTGRARRYFKVNH